LVAGRQAYLLYLKDALIVSEPENMELDGLEHSQKKGNDMFF